MIYVGGFSVVLSALLMWRVYSRYLREQLDMSGEFLRALKDYRDKIRCYLTSPSDWAKGYIARSDKLSDLLMRVSDGESFTVAYRDVRKTYSLPDEIDGILDGCFSALGEGYLEVELAILDGAIKNIDEIYLRLSGDFMKKEKGVGAMLGACAVGAVILMI